MRYLFGAIDDWDALFQEAYRVCKPGGWVESCETEPLFRSDDNTAESNWGLARMNKMYREGGQKIGRTFCVIEEDRQMKGMKEAGFTDIQQVNSKVRATYHYSAKEVALRELLTKWIPLVCYRRLAS